MRVKLVLLATALCYWPVAEAGEMSITVGAKSDTTLGFTLEGEEYGFFAGYRFDSEIEEDVLDYPVPHNDFRTLGNMRVDNSYALGGTYRYAFSDKHALRFQLAIGVEDYREVAQSNATGWYYTQKENTEVSPALGLLYRFTANEKLRLLLGGDTFLGLQAGLSFNF